MRKTDGIEKSKNHLLYLALFLFFIPTFSGCEFFGRKDDDNGITSPGLFTDGTSFLGTWTVVSANTSPTGEPSFAMSSSYTFLPSGAVTVEYKDLHIGGISCTGYGQFRQPSAHEVLIYIQSTNNPNCGFPSLVHLSNVQILPKSMKFTDADSNEEYTYFLNNHQDLAPVGIWDFDSAGGTNGEGGLDYLIFDPYGYFILQTTSGGVQYQMIGFYIVNTAGHLILYDFNNMDPVQTQGVLLDFTQYVTDGQVLQLVQPDGAGGSFVSTGYRF